MRLDELNAKLAAHRFLVEVAVRGSEQPPFSKAQLVQVNRHSDESLYIKVSDLTTGITTTFWQTHTGSEVWENVFPDPFTDEPCVNSRHPGYLIKGLITEHID